VAANGTATRELSPLDTASSPELGRAGAERPPPPCEPRPCRLFATKGTASSAISLRQRVGGAKVSSMRASNPDPGRLVRQGRLRACSDRPSPASCSEHAACQKGVCLKGYPRRPKISAPSQKQNRHSEARPKWHEVRGRSCRSGGRPSPRLGLDSVTRPAEMVEFPAGASRGMALHLESGDNSAS